MHRNNAVQICCTVHGLLYIQHHPRHGLDHSRCQQTASILISWTATYFPPTAARRRRSATWSRLQLLPLAGRRIDIQRIIPLWQTLLYDTQRYYVSANGPPILTRDAMRKRGVCCCPVSVRLSRWCIVPRRLKISSNFFLVPVTTSF